MRYGHWTVLEQVPAPNGKHKRRFFRIRCDCGYETTQPLYNLQIGTSTQCRRCAWHGHRKVPEARAGAAHPRWKGAGAVSGHFFGLLLKSARDRGLVVEVTPADLWAKFQEQEGRCVYTGMELRFRSGRSPEERGTASVDRIDSGRGYVLDNVQWVHKAVNLMKQDLNEETFIRLCVAVVHHRARRVA